MNRRCYLFLIVLLLGAPNSLRAEMTAEKVESALGYFVESPFGPRGREIKFNIVGAGAVAVQPVAKRLQSEDANMRQIAVELLTSLYPHSKKEMKGVVDALRDPALTVRLQAIEAFDEHADFAVENLAALVALLQDNSDPTLQVHRRVIDACGRLKEMAKPAAPAIIAAFPTLAPGIRREAIHALARMELPADVVLPIYISALNHPELMVHAASEIEPLGSAAAAATPALEAALKLPGAPKYELARTLAAVAGSRADVLSIALEGLRSADRGVRSSGLVILLKLGEGAVPAIPEIAKLLSTLKLDDGTGHHRMAMQILKANAAQCKPAVPALCGELRRLPRFEHKSIYEIFQTLGTDAKEAAPLLLEFLSAEKDGGARFQLRKTLNAIGQFQEAEPKPQNSTESLLEAAGDTDYIFRLKAQEALKALGDEHLPALRTALQSPKPGIRANAVRALYAHKSRTDADVELVVALFKNEPDAEVRRAITSYLSRSAVRRAENHQPNPLALLGLKDPDAGVRLNSMRALTLTPLEPALLRDTVVSSLKDPNVDLQHAALMLARFSPVKPTDPMIMDAVVAYAADPKTRWRTNALEILFSLRVPADRAIPILVDALKVDAGDVAPNAAKALGEYGPQALPARDALIARLQTGTPAARAAAARALYQLRVPPESVVNPLREMIRRDPAQPPATDAELEAVIDVLADLKVDAGSAVPDLMALLATSGGRFERQILHALRAIGVRTEDGPVLLNRARAKGENSHLALSAAATSQPLPEGFVPTLRDALTRIKAYDEEGKFLLKLMRLPPDISVPLYLEQLQHPNAEIRQYCAEDLVNARPMATATREALLAVAQKDGEANVREAALNSSCRFVDKKFREELRPILNNIRKNDASRVVREAAAEILIDWDE